MAAVEIETTLHHRILKMIGLSKYWKGKNINQCNYKSVQYICFPVTLCRDANSSGIGPQREAGDQLSEEPK